MDLLGSADVDPRVIEHRHLSAHQNEDGVHLSVVAFPVKTFQGRQVIPGLVDVCPIQARVALVFED